MSDRTGLNAVECAVLEALDEVGARAGRPHRKSISVLLGSASTRAVGVGYSYDALCQLSQPWRMHIPVVDVHGNHGSPDGDEPANPRYTEARLAPTGALVLASERREIPRLPVGFINGDLHAQGSRPPFDPTRVVRAVLHAGANPSSTDDELVTILGPPSAPTGCDVRVDMTELAETGQATMHMCARVDVEEARSGAPTLVVRDQALGVGPSEIARAIADRASRAMRRLQSSHPDVFEKLAIPLRDVRDEGNNDHTCIVVELERGADVDAARRRILETWPVTIRVEVALGAPPASIVRSWVDEPTRQQSALEELVRK